MFNLKTETLAFNKYSDTKIDRQLSRQKLVGLPSSSFFFQLNIFESSENINFDAPPPETHKRKNLFFFLQNNA